MLREERATAAHASADLRAIVQSGDVVAGGAEIGSDLVQRRKGEAEIGGKAGQGLAIDAARKDVPQNGVGEAVRGEVWGDLLHDSSIPALQFRPAGLGAVRCGGSSLCHSRKARKVKIACASKATFDLFEAFCECFLK
jgi:hypothetical protein